MIKCQICGNENSDESLICGWCGHSIKDVESIATGEDTIIPVKHQKISICIILSIITIGLYEWYWQYQLIKNTRVLKQDYSSCISELFLFIFPFYNLYWFFTRGNTVRDELSKKGYSTKSDGKIFVILNLLCLGIVSMAIMQNDFNSLACKSSDSIEDKAIKIHSSIKTFGLILLAFGLIADIISIPMIFSASVEAFGIITVIGTICFIIGLAFAFI